MRTALFLGLASVTGLIAFAACPASTGSNEGEGENSDAGTEILDGGFTGEGEGEGQAGEGEGEGAPADAGFQGSEYTGAPEDGVKCGNDDPAIVCDIGTNCCVSFDQTGANAQCGTAGQDCPPPAVFGASVLCDGKEDCQAGEECCFDSNTFTTTCVAAGTCEATNGSSTVCVNTDDCVAGTEICCGAPGAGGGGAFTLPVDMGICQPADQNCSG